MAPHKDLVSLEQSYMPSPCVDFKMFLLCSFAIILVEIGSRLDPYSVSGHTHTHTHTHARMHTHTHTCTDTKYSADFLWLSPQDEVDLDGSGRPTLPNFKEQECPCSHEYQDVCQASHPPLTLHTHTHVT